MRAFIYHGGILSTHIVVCLHRRTRRYLALTNRPHATHARSVLARNATCNNEQNGITKITCTYSSPPPRRPAFALCIARATPRRYYNRYSNIRHSRHSSNSLRHTRFVFENFTNRLRKPGYKLLGPVGVPPRRSTVLPTETTDSTASYRPCRRTLQKLI